MPVSHPAFEEVSSTFPGWIESRLENVQGRLNALEPYPFCHPSKQLGMVQLHQNDYLRLSSRPEVRFAKMEAIRRSNSDFLGSNLFVDSREADNEHENFRLLLRQCLQVEDVLLSTSGWAANVGLLEALCDKDTRVYLDRKCHASLWDGARLAGARCIMVRHNDPQALERRIRRDGAGIVCIDSFYSNSGAVCDLESYVEICERTGSLLVLDEAHSMGMIGEGAGGLAVACGLASRVPFRTASLSKALGGHGGMVACSAAVARYLAHRAHSHVFSTAGNPCDSAAHRVALEIARAEPELAGHTLAMGAKLRQEMTNLGIPCGLSACQLVSIQLSTEPLTAALYGKLRDRGILASVFMHPAVPYGTGLVRFSAHAQLVPEDMVRTALALAESLDELGIDPRSVSSA